MTDRELLKLIEDRATEDPRLAKRMAAVLARVEAGVEKKKAGRKTKWDDGMRMQLWFLYRAWNAEGLERPAIADRVGASGLFGVLSKDTISNELGRLIKAHAAGAGLFARWEVPEPTRATLAAPTDIAAAWGATATRIADDD